MRLAALFLTLSGMVAAQTPAPPAELRYSGQPLVLPFHCTDDDITWAGLSCTDDEPCPVYLELTAVEAVGNKIFLIGNLHTGSVTLFSLVLASDDTGATWREAHPRMRGAGLDHLQFIDFETGWIAGQLLSPLPQDPFLLITNDGGKSFRQHNLFGETRVGSIQQFWFSAKNAGALVVDRGQGAEGSRYELYESPNAGETWMVRESSDRLLKLKRAPPVTSAWRIRADAPSQSFRIERPGSGDRFTAVAAFKVPIGACTPEPRKEAPEPTAEEPPAQTPPPAGPMPPRRAAPPTLKRNPR